MNTHTPKIQTTLKRAKTLLNHTPLPIQTQHLPTTQLRTTTKQNKKPARPSHLSTNTLSNTKLTVSSSTSSKSTSTLK
ncbi:hypothetical protein [Candidatus Bathycorpusculum sp.]|uniref:hypothetical protein n=1 Tax=Candidatus Bathycorpusculum sp. TaxID=2994959 RepID=UPI00282D3078|nr:hypothetical protein [Candidatus Termitimicrobium sp.]MCL2686853.1 hypothetical protein [Candidatus Termitimicrobium sp.]